jgi:hypothetical protein
MPGALDAAVPRQRDVDRLVDQHSSVSFGLEFGLASRERRAHRGPGLAHPLAGCSARGGWELADLPIRQRERRTVARVCEPGGSELIQVGRLGNGGERVVDVALHLLRLQRNRLDRVVAHERVLK